MTLVRRIPRQVARHRARYLSLVLLIALGSVALITLNLVKDTLQASFDRLGESGQVEDVRAWLTTEPTNLESLGHFYQVEIEPRTSLDLELPDDVTLRVFDRSERVDKPVILRGRDIRNDHEMLLNPSFAAAQGLAIGDQLILPEGNWRICGFFTLPDYIYPTQHESDLMADISHFGIAIISKPAMEYLLHTVDLTDQDITMDRSYGIRYRPGYLAIKQRLKDRYGLVRWLESKDNARINMVKSEIAGIREMTAAIPTAIFLINCALLASVLWRMIRLEFRTIGTLRALGLGRGEILRHYLALPLVLAVIGSSIGTACGLVLAKPVLAYYAAFYNLPVDQLQIDWQLMLASVLIPIVLLMATASFVILRAIRLPPLALIRGYSRKPKAMKLEKLIHFHKARFETKFRVRQSVRSIGKLLVAMGGMAFATMLTLTGFMVQDSYTYLMDQGIKGTFRYDQNYVFKELQDDNDYGGEPYQLRAVIETGSQEAIVVFGLSEDGKLLHLADQQGRIIDLSTRNMTRMGTTVKTGVISRVLADRLKLNVGNTLSLIDNIENEIYFIRIGAIAENYTQLAVYLPIDVFNDLFDLPEGRFKGIFSDQVLAIDSEDLALNEQMDDVLTSFETYAGMIKMMLLGLGLLSSAMALLILYILIALLIEENSRSIALLKILGYDSREIRNLILRTLNIPVLAGFALGIPLLFKLYGQMLERSFAEIDMSMPLILSPEYMAAGFALLYATYLLTRKITGRKIFKISMVDGLKSMQE